MPKTNMRSFRFISLLLLLCLTCGCRTTQKVADDVTTTAVQTETAHVVTNATVTNTLSEDEVLEVEQTVTEWSEPDSLGKQHPKKSTLTKVKRRRTGTGNTVQTKDEQRSKGVQTKVKVQKKKNRETTVKDAAYDTLKMYGILGLFAAGALGYIYIRSRR